MAQVSGPVDPGLQRISRARVRDSRGPPPELPCECGSTYEVLRITNALWPPTKKSGRRRRSGQRRRVKRAEEEAKRVKREEMEYLAATRPPPVPLSPQRARQLFEPRAGAGGWVTAAFSASPITPPQTPARIAASNDHTHVPTIRHPGLPAYTGMQDFETRQDPGLYAVHAHGHNRVFNNRARALEVLEDTPGGELVFVGDEQKPLALPG
ncbi:hypothetical protein B0H14DRAFT_3537468 [Mycena olivaceomarginata]|nr:hypothetical protein B0H14DRAFT_3537468 [Mycena olivaceomarginata]